MSTSTDWAEAYAAAVVRATDGNEPTRWRVERAIDGKQWMTIGPNGHGCLWPTWRIAYTLARWAARTGQR